MTAHESFQANECDSGHVLSSPFDAGLKCTQHKASTKIWHSVETSYLISATAVSHIVSISTRLVLKTSHYNTKSIGILYLSNIWYYLH